MFSIFYIPADSWRFQSFFPPLIDFSRDVHFGDSPSTDTFSHDVYFWDSPSVGTFLRDIHFGNPHKLTEQFRNFNFHVDPVCFIMDPWLPLPLRKGSVRATLEKPKPKQSLCIWFLLCRMHHDAMLTVPYTHIVSLGGCMWFQSGSSALKLQHVFLSSGTLLMVSVTHDPKALFKENGKLRAAVPVACVCVCVCACVRVCVCACVCVCSAVLGTICFSSRTAHNETNCVQTGAYTLGCRGAVQCMVIDLVITISESERYSFYKCSADHEAVRCEGCNATLYFWLKLSDANPDFLWMLPFMIDDVIGFFLYWDFSLT